MKIPITTRAKPADITTLGTGASEKIDDNFQRLFADVRSIVNALRGYRVDLGSSDDVTGTPGTGTGGISDAIRDAINAAIDAAIAAAFVPAGVDEDVQYNDHGAFGGRPFRAFGYYAPLSVAKAQNSADLMTHLAPELVFMTNGDTIMIWKPGAV